MFFGSTMMSECTIVALHHSLDSCLSGFLHTVFNYLLNRKTGHRIVQASVRFTSECEKLCNRSCVVKRCETL